MLLYFALALIAVIAALVAGYYIGQEHAEAKHLCERIEALEAAANKHLPYWADDEAMSISYALRRYMDERQAGDEYLQNALGHCEKFRAGKPKKGK